MDAVIPGQILRRLAREWKLRLDDVEKHYVLGWILFGISKSTVARNLAFKGGTSLSKIYFPSEWRLSEDLDFTVLDDVDFDKIIKILDEEIPSRVNEESQILLKQKEKPHTNEGYLQYKMGYNGPIGNGTIKIETTRERFVGYMETKNVANIPSDFDYPKFSVQVYTLETLIGEKLRTVLERGYVRDYYDVWRLLKEKEFDRSKALKMFNEKCKAKGITFSSIDQFFPDGIIETLRPHLQTSLVRLSRDPPPALETMLEELRPLLQKFLS